MLTQHELEIKVYELERQMKDSNSLILRLSEALLTHTRTDLAPDTALPLMKMIVKDAKLNKKIIK